MIVVIAEKPDQGAKLASPFNHKKRQGFIEIMPNSIFAQGALVTWAVGHVCELVPPEEYDPRLKKWSMETLPILPDKFRHRVSPSKAKQFAVIKSLLQRPDVTEIVHAGDAGREGEYIVRIAVQLSGVKKPMKRLWISSLTPKAVEQGFRNLKDEADTRPLYYEAVSRSCADWLVGMNGSRVYSLLLQRRGIREVFSTGRVQSPTLALIVAREKEIINFKPEPFWELKAKFIMQGAAYEGTWFKDEQTRFPSLEEAEEIRRKCEDREARVHELETERKEFQPPQLFNLSTLQAVANQVYKYSPQNTLAALQRLYLEGYISYPRSDSAYVTPEEAKQFPDILGKLGREDAFKAYYPLPHPSIANNKRFVNAAKVSDHYAIIPTEVIPQMNRLKPDERNLYELIVKRLIAAHYDKAIIDYSRLITMVGDEETFLTKGKLVVQEGWRSVLYDYESQEDRDQENIPPLAVGDTGLIEDLYIKEGKTQAPKRYTEGQLITLMKTAGKHLDDAELEKILEKTEGLGTEATRAGIIAILKDRSYIEVRKNMVYATPKGMMLVDALGDSILASAEMTAKWEQRLHEVGQGKASPQSFMEQARRLSQKIIEDALHHSRTWTFTADMLQQAGQAPQPGTQRGGAKPSRRSGAAASAGTSRSGAGAHSAAVSRKAAGSRGAAAGANAAEAASASLGHCPRCQADVMEEAYTYKCSANPSCSFSISKKVLGKAISAAQIKRFLSKGATATLKGFKKGDKTFAAALVWNKEQDKVSFQFNADR